MKYGLVLNDLLMKKTKVFVLLVDIGCSLADDNDFINVEKIEVWITAAASPLGSN